MTLRRYSIKLTQLQCIKESDPGASEPYLWVTYFAHGPQIPPFQTGPLAISTPSYDAFRTEFPSMSPGDIANIPSFIASASFDMDMSSIQFGLLGCVAVLLEEDDTKQTDIAFGRIAYAKEIEKQLNKLAEKRIQTRDTSPVTGNELSAIANAVQSKVVDAIRSRQGIFDILTDHDDFLGFAHATFFDRAIAPRTFRFPDIITTKKNGENTIVTDRYVLSGELTIEDVTTVPTRCDAQRTAYSAKKREIAGLRQRVRALQQLLQHATPQQKPAIIDEIGKTNEQIDLAEAQLPDLEAALISCMGRPHRGDADMDGVVVTR